jgi:ABC-2 type transport system ATP-binding protein
VPALRGPWVRRSVNRLIDAATAQRRYAGIALLFAQVVAVIQFDGLGKQYGEFAAVHDLTFSVAGGEVFGFLGPNGAGKTTTIRMMMGILVPSSGRATIDGLDCQAERVEVKRRVGYLPDSPIFYDFLRGREILEFVGEMHGQSPGDARRHAARLMEELALGDAAEEYAVNYSMGMKKKLGLACALIHDPAVLILDEPTNGLDPRAAREVQDLLRASAARGKTIFLSTHLLDMAERLCTRLGIIHKGELVAVGELEALRREVVPGGTLEEVFLKATQSDEDDPAGTGVAGSPA